MSGVLYIRHTGANDCLVGLYLQPHTPQLDSEAHVSGYLAVPEFHWLQIISITIPDICVRGAGHIGGLAHSLLFQAEGSFE